MKVVGMNWLRRGWAPALVLLLACSGEAVIDEGGGGGSGGSTTTTATSTSSGTTTTTTTATSSSSSGGGCDALTVAYEDALMAARACNACIDGPDPCQYLSGPPLADPCGCPVSVNSFNPDLVQTALATYNQWVDAGCGPYPCGQPCAISSNPTCESMGGSCDGQCGL